MASDEVQTLIDEWGMENVRAAFWLQAHIKRNGLDGIGYMKTARGHLESTKRLTTKSIVESELDESY